MDRYLLDSSAVSDVIQRVDRRPPNVARHSKQYLRSHKRFTFSEISCFETLRGFRKTRASRRLHEFTTFCEHAELLPVDYEVLDIAATLWADGQNAGIIVGDVDLIIAATALHHRLALVTSNTRHFDWIPGLTLIDWRKP